MQVIVALALCRVGSGSEAVLRHWVARRRLYHVVRATVHRLRRLVGAAPHGAARVEEAGRDLGAALVPRR